MRAVEFARAPISVAAMFLTGRRSCPNQHFFPRSLARVSPLALALVVLAMGAGCDRKEKPAENDAPISEADKQERLAALLKENGVDPNSLPTAQAPLGGAPAPSVPSPQGSTAADSAPAPNNAAAAEPATAGSALSAASNNAPASAPTTPGAPPIAVRVLSSGAGPKAALRYGFKQGDNHKFVLDIQVAAERKVNGQVAPGMPPFSLSLRGSTTTLQADMQGARRQHTFIEMIPTVSGAPPELAEQIKAQYASLGGLQLVETVNTRGMILGMDLDSRAIQPQVLALMQHLQDGMTNAFLALPEEAVGPGARWSATTTTDAAGIQITQENIVSLVAQTGDNYEFTLQLKQSAKPSKITGANLPPGVSIDLTKVDGNGKGSMKVNFKDIVITSKVELSTAMETAVTQPEVQGITKEAATTTVKAQISITK